MFTKTEIINTIKAASNEIHFIRSELNPSCICIQAANYGIRLADDRYFYLNSFYDEGKASYNFAADCFTTPLYEKEAAEEIAKYINENDERKVVVVKPRLRKNLEELIEMKKETIKAFCQIYKTL